MDKEAASSRRWTEDETLLALYLYFQLPFGKLHSGNPEIQQLAQAIGRSSSSVAMKLCNFASLDPKIFDSGRKGLQGASKLDKSLYALFGNDWSGLVLRTEQLWSEIVLAEQPVSQHDQLKEHTKAFAFEPFQGPSTAEGIVTRRVGQDFFRRAVLANYTETCCITGISEPRVLVASHIVPWSVDVENRHNPSNGLLLSATFDKAYDCGLISVDAGRKVHISNRLVGHTDQRTRECFELYDGQPISAAARFLPEPAFLEWHFKNVFLDNKLTA